MNISRWSTAATLLALSACGSSPPLRYYTLEVIAPANSAAAATSLQIHVRHIGLPPEVDHRGLTHSTGAHELAISDSDQWGAPLATLIQGTLSADLGARLGYEHVVAPAALPVTPPATPDRRGMRPEGPASLDVDFLKLTADSGCGVEAQVNWSLSAANVVVRHGSVHLTAPATTCPAGLPAALSTALSDFADQLSQQLTAP